MTGSGSQGFSAADVIDFFKLDISKTSLLKAEASKRIPLATRVERGSVSSRIWKLSDLPEIGTVFGKFRKPTSTRIISTYVPKGGVGKTFWTFNFSRILAFHGIKVLVVGCDFQCSLSKSFRIKYDSDEIPLSLYDAIVENVDINDLITDTDIPTLKLIPESQELNLLDRNLIVKNKREYVVKKQLEKLKEKFDVIIFDNPPQWNSLVTATLVASDSIICPLNADGESFHSFKMFMSELSDFTSEMDKEFKLVKFIPNNVDRTKYSSTFRSKLLKDYNDLFSSNFIKQSITIKESGTVFKSVLEYNAKSPASDNLYDVVYEVWSDILASEEN